MRTKSIKLFYKVTQMEVIPPMSADIERKDKWLAAVKASVPSEWQPKIVSVEYTEYDPEVENQRKFFSVCVLYYAIQNEHMLTGVPDNKLLARYREELLDEMLGYDIQLIHKTKRARKSTKRWDVQKWNTFLHTFEETVFDNAGFVFPDSKAFWELVKQLKSHEGAKRISIERLQKTLAKKHE